MTRIEKINQYGIDQRNKAARDRANLEKTKEALSVEIRALRPRIALLIETANTALDNGIKLQDITGVSARGNYTCDRSTHIGFAQSGAPLRLLAPKMVSKLGIDAVMDGEGCFRTNGINVYAAIKGQKNAQRKASLEHMKQFLAEFDAFERDFYAYIDGIVGTSEGADSHE